MKEPDSLTCKKFGGCVNDELVQWQSQGFARICQAVPNSNLGKAVEIKPVINITIQVDNYKIEQSQIVQACGFLSIDVIQQLGATLSR